MWSIAKAPEKTSDELFDSYIQRNGVGITFEHKSMRVPNSFWMYGDGDRCLGGPASTLAKRDQGASVTAAEVKEYMWRGMLTRGLWQMNNALPKIPDWARTTFGEAPHRILSLQTLLAETPVDIVAYRGFIKPLIMTFRMFRGHAPPLYVGIAELEALADLADQGNLDLLFLLDEASRLGMVDFDEIIRSAFDYVPVDHVIKDRVVELMKRGSEIFWGRVITNEILDSCGKPPAFGR